jgi:hypothetical protein
MAGKLQHIRCCTLLENLTPTPAVHAAPSPPPSDNAGAPQTIAEREQLEAEEEAAAEAAKKRLEERKVGAGWEGRGWGAANGWCWGLGPCGNPHHHVFVS